MAEKGVVLGQTAARQLMDLMRRDYRTYRNQPPPPQRQPVIREGPSTFWAVITDKISVEIIDDPNDPIFDKGCAPSLLPLLRGTYTFAELEESTTSPFPGHRQIKEGGRFGNAGECDAAYEVNRSNANIHIERMVVLMHTGNPFETSVECPSSQDVSSALEYFGSSAEMVSTNIRYWFDLNSSREDCANPFVVSAAAGNDFPP